MTELCRNNSIREAGNQTTLNFTRTLSDPSACAFIQSVQRKGEKLLLLNRSLIRLSAILCSISLFPASAASEIRGSNGHLDEWSLRQFDKEVIY